MKKISFEFIKFAMVGVVNTLVHLIVLFILVEYFSVYYILASVVAFLLAVTNSFFLNTLWTFRKKYSFMSKLSWGKFTLIGIIAILINTILLYVLTDFFSLWYMYSQVIAILASFSVNFFGNKFWTYRNDK
jgi:putative flippase GtrA